MHKIQAYVCIWNFISVFIYGTAIFFKKITIGALKTNTRMCMGVGLRYIYKKICYLTRFFSELHEHAVGAPKLPTQRDLVRLKATDRLISSISQQLQASKKRRNFYRTYNTVSYNRHYIYYVPTYVYNLSTIKLHNCHHAVHTVCVCVYRWCGF